MSPLVGVQGCLLGLWMSQTSICWIWRMWNHSSGAGSGCVCVFQDGQSRTIRQFQFTDWPEQGVPKTGEGFIDFIGQVHKTKEQFGQDGPIAVHCRCPVFICPGLVCLVCRRRCWSVLPSRYRAGALSTPPVPVFNASLTVLSASAGVGRTGVFIALSIALERMRFEGVVDLFQTVKTLRTQRPAMVQTEVGAAAGGVKSCARWVCVSLSLFPGPVPPVLPICSGIPGKLWSLCNIIWPGKAPRERSGVCRTLSPRLHPPVMRRRLRTAAGTGS